LSYLAYPVALAAAAIFALAIPLEHRAADRTPEVGGFRPRQLASFVGATVRNKWWLIGMGLSTLGFGLHTLALNLGALAVVQPLRVTQLLFALPVNHWLRREPIKPNELVWAAVLVVGLSGFLAVATAGVRPTHDAADRGPSVAVGVLVVLATSSLALAARRIGGRTGATLLGAATGVLFAVTASLNKECTGLIAQGPLTLLSSWQLYAFPLVTAVAILFNQLAYQAGPLSASLPAIVVVDPLVAILLGITVFDEELRHSPPAIIGEVVLLGLLALGGLNLARLAAAPEDEPKELLIRRSAPPSPPNAAPPRR
jgi:drug/metabolite transporter (DMT)-like permease